MRDRDRLIDDALVAVGLDHAAKSYPWQLSGGMQQRVAIARAVAYQPEVLIMDEPFAAVDAQTRADLEDLVRTLHRERGMSILFVTHDIDESVYLGERVVVLSKSPTWVQEDLAIDLAPERDQISTRALPRFTELRTHVYEQIQRAKRGRGRAAGCVRLTSDQPSRRRGRDAKSSAEAAAPGLLRRARRRTRIELPLRASVLIEVLEGAGVAAPATQGDTRSDGAAAASSPASAVDARSASR